MTLCYSISVDNHVAMESLSVWTPGVLIDSIATTGIEPSLLNGWESGQIDVCWAINA